MDLPVFLNACPFFFVAVNNPGSEEDCFIGGEELNLEKLVPVNGYRIIGVLKRPSSIVVDPC